MTNSEFEFSSVPEKKVAGEPLPGPTNVENLLGGFIAKRVGGRDMLKKKLLKGKNFECAFCHGSGKTRLGTLCQICRGEGENPFESPVVACAFCRGSGAARPGITCTCCKGTGYHHVNEPIDFCQKCHGRGSAGGGGLPCYTCKGSGVVEKISV